MYESAHEATVNVCFTQNSCSKCDHGLRMRLLLVEDDQALARVLVRGLVEDGHALDVAGTVPDANYALAINEYDLVVLDLGLPDDNGLDVCTALRKSESMVPVLMLTARDSLDDKVLGLDAGADDYLTKPFDYPELAARVRALLRRPVNATATVLQVGTVKLDPASHRVWCGSIVVPLTAKEFSLLEYLLRFPGEVVTRTALLEHVWDSNYDGLSNVVDVHVANLRRKLRQPKTADIIETVRGVGYRVADA